MFTKLLKLFLYLTLGICLVWGAIILVGPSIALTVIDRKFGNTIQIAGLKITPSLNIYATRVEFQDFKHSDDDPISGYSRAVSIKVDGFVSKRPLVTLTTGPTEIDDILTYDKASLDIFFEDKFLFGSFKVSGNLRNLNYDDKMSLVDLSLETVFERNPAILRDIDFTGQGLSSTFGNQVSANTFFGTIKTGNGKSNIRNKFVGIISHFEDLDIGSGLYRAKKISVSSNLEEAGYIFKATTDSIDDSRSNTNLRNISVKINFDPKKSNSWKFFEFEVGEFETSGTKLSDEKLILHNINFNVDNVDGNEFKIEGDGQIERLSLSNDRLYIGDFSGVDFNLISTVVTNSVLDSGKINYGVSLTGEKKIDLTGDVTFKTLDESLVNCVLKNCFFTALDVFYNFAIGSQVLHGKAVCLEKICNAASMQHTVKTNNTNAFFFELSSLRFLNPLLVAALIGQINSGQKIGDGHIYNF